MPCVFLRVIRATPLSLNYDIKSKAEQGKKILLQASKNAMELSKRYTDYITQIDSALKRMLIHSDKAYDRLNAQENRFHRLIQAWGEANRRKISEHVWDEITKINREKAKIDKAEKEMKLLVQTWENTNTSEKIISEAKTAVQKVVDLSSSVVNTTATNISAPDFIPGPTETIQGISAFQFFGEFGTENLPVFFPNNKPEDRKLELPLEKPTLMENPPIAECNPQKVFTIQGGGEVKQICSLGDNMVVYSEMQDRASLSIYNTEGEKLCTADDGEYSRYCYTLLNLRQGGAVTDMATIIPKNSNDVYLMTCHRDKNWLVSWDLDVQRIQQGHYYLTDLLAHSFISGCPEWICSSKKGVLYLVEGKSPHQEVQMIGVLAAKRRKGKGKERVRLSPEFHLEETQEIGLPGVTGLACYKSQNKEDVLVFKSSAFGGSVIAKKASNLQTLWQLNNINVTSMCSDRQRNLLYVLQNGRDGSGSIHVN